MVVRLNSNIGSLQAQRRLAQTSESLSATYERLSSGLRINRASDDAAGLAIASSLQTDTRVFTQAIRNINDGVSALSIADGTLQELSSIVQRQKELAEQAANGTYSRTQRLSIHAEANALTKEFNRIVEATSFNGIKLLDGSVSDLRIQAGAGLNAHLGFALGGELGRTVGTGTYGPGVDTALTHAQDVSLGDLNGDGKLDRITASGSGNYFNVAIGNGDGSFRAVATYNSTNLTEGVVGDFNRDGKLDYLGAQDASGNVFFFQGNGDGSFQAARTYTSSATDNDNITVSDFNGDGVLDFVTISTSDDVLAVMLGNGDGSFKSAQTFASGDLFIYAAATGDLNGDGKIDIINRSTNTDLMILYGNGDGSFQAGRSIVLSATSKSDGAPALADFNQDGYLDIVTSQQGNSNTVIILGNGNGTFKAAVTYANGGSGYTSTADINGDGFADVTTISNVASQITTAFGNGDGTFKAAMQNSATGIASSFDVGDINGDGAFELYTTASAGQFTLYSPQTAQVASTQFLNLMTQSEARDSLNVVDTTLSRISLELGSIGAFMSRLESAQNTLFASREGYSAAASRIMDVDVASEGAELTRKQILQQAASAVLAQANLAPELALSLLRS